MAYAHGIDQRAETDKIEDCLNHTLGIEAAGLGDTTADIDDRNTPVATA
jgi:hypothetical protein